VENVDRSERSIAAKARHRYFKKMWDKVIACIRVLKPYRRENSGECEDQELRWLYSNSGRSHRPSPVSWEECRRYILSSGSIPTHMTGERGAKLYCRDGGDENGAECRVTMHSLHTNSRHVEHASVVVVVLRWYTAPSIR
jgi:hypothetical protein